MHEQANTGSQKTDESGQVEDANHEQHDIE